MYLCWYHEQAVKQAVQLPVISDALKLIRVWHHGNVRVMSSALEGGYSHGQRPLSVYVRPSVCSTLPTHMQTVACACFIFWYLVGSPEDSPLKRPAMWSFVVFVDVGLSLLLNRQSYFRWFETTWRSCDITVMITFEYQICYQIRWLQFGSSLICTL